MRYTSSLPTSFVRRTMFLTRAFGSRTSSRSGHARKTYALPSSTGFVTAKPVPVGTRSTCHTSSCASRCAAMAGVVDAAGFDGGAADWPTADAATVRPPRRRATRPGEGFLIGSRHRREDGVEVVERGGRPLEPAIECGKVEMHRGPVGQQERLLRLPGGRLQVAEAGL